MFPSKNIKNTVRVVSFMHLCPPTTPVDNHDNQFLVYPFSVQSFIEWSHMYKKTTLQRPTEPAFKTEILPSTNTMMF